MQPKSGCKVFEPGCHPFAIVVLPPKAKRMVCLYGMVAMFLLVEL